eukprot:CAMPEP_0172554844 /NCGR_PEP_ID=MMETSP1067-20121228/56673_1 /TAXON_ID=265564 ORGANISM="Thalassiosira punctigera, Strain Tpunct2005C2" /NCGR_SAMPLE_ID=MMETSP1067 /ASSEMBLY_ACC=CAM_ASM_000444 /LENGTH=423 /DNA_ID=CAMNT_0013343291 /DNA_START=125 /DNA_END=1396 /DNA_ORIENTATION=+
MVLPARVAIFAAVLSQSSTAFVPRLSRAVTAIERSAATISDDLIDGSLDKHKELERQRLKQSLLGRLGGSSLPSGGTEGGSESNVVFDSILADPLTKEPLSVYVKGPILGGISPRSGLSIDLRASSDSDRAFQGRTNTYINLLEPASGLTESDDVKTAVSSSPFLSSLLTLAPPPLRPIIANVTRSDVEYIPMRDLFTSPSVSFAYERGWRQGFVAGGFPGADEEFELAKTYFAPVIEQNRANDNDSVLVDMSCATGLFARRFTKSDEYSRVIACDYSDSMLTEARRRIRGDSEITSSPTKLDLVRCDVANIPMRSGSIDAFHAGAAMHCWPEIESSLEEIHRVLVPGGRYFATTFLGNYFSNLAATERAANGGVDLESNIQAFQYFPNEEYLRDLLLGAGFEKDKVSLERVGRACVIIRCEK